MALAWALKLNVGLGLSVWALRVGPLGLGFVSLWGLGLVPGPEGVTWVTLGLPRGDFVGWEPGLELTRSALGWWPIPVSC